MLFAREVIIPHQAPLATATSVRSTLLQSSLATLRTRGHMERYLQLVDPNRREEIIASIAPSWLSIELGEAHYRACDALELDSDELIAIGESVGDRMQGPYMETLTRTARNLGVTPWCCSSASMRSGDACSKAAASSSRGWDRRTC